MPVATVTKTVPKKKTAVKTKLVTDEQFDRAIIALTKLNDSQLGRLWEAVRVETRLRFFNSGLASAIRALQELSQDNPVAKASLTKAIAAIEAKTWQRK